MAYLLGLEISHTMTCSSGFNLAKKELYLALPEAAFPSGSHLFDNGIAHRAKGDWDKLTPSRFLTYPPAVPTASALSVGAPQDPLSHLPWGPGMYPFAWTFFPRCM